MADEPISVGSACSGSSIDVHFLKTLSECIQDEFGATVVFQHRFVCEHKDEKLEFLKSHYNEQCQAYFRDAHELAESSTIDQRTGQMATVPWVRLFMAGFSCIDRSKLNRNASKNRGCVKAGTGSTGSSWAAIASYITKVGPDMIVLENVKDLLDKDGDQHSDADHIDDLLKQQKSRYSRQVISARDYGSAARRVRLYWMAAKANLDLSILGLTLQACRLKPLADERFLKPLEITKRPHKSKAQASTENQKWKEEHMALFAAQGVPWPPAFEEDGPVELRADGPLQHLSERQLQIVWLLSKLPKAARRHLL